MLIVGTAHMEIEQQVIHPDDDTAPLFQWTDEQMNTLKEIEEEDQELIMRKLPPLLSAFMQNLYHKALTETFDREM